uniref:Uncharacterized protein n=1 Tax=Leersia perrieri TaxID=77586 RepID=A0A0D9XR29_9ORYZ
MDSSIAGNPSKQPEIPIQESEGDYLHEWPAAAASCAACGDGGELRHAEVRTPERLLDEQAPGAGEGEGRGPRRVPIDFLSGR